MNERTIHEKYLRKVGNEIYSRGIQSVHLKDYQTQTEKRRMESKSTQYQFCDHPSNDQNINYDRMRLLSFLKKSGKLIDGLLTNKTSDNTTQKLLTSDTNQIKKHGLSQGITFVYQTLLQNRTVNDISFSNNNSNIIAVAYSKLPNYSKITDDEKETRNAESETYVNKNIIVHDGLVCIWDIRKPSYPIYQLICDDQVKKIMYLPNNDNIIIGGRENGCIAAWDLSESNKLHLRYPTYMTDCQWNNNHLHSITALKFMNEDEFCSVDTFGIINGWQINQETDLNPLDLGCRNQQTLKITHQFKFNIDTITLSKYKYCNKYGDCISIHPRDETKLLYAHQQSIYLLERIGSDIDIIDEFTFKYDVVGISHSNNNIISVAVKFIQIFYLFSHYNWVFH